MNDQLQNKTYLGDGVYARFTGYDFVLTTENGIEVTNEIVVDGQILAALAAFAERMRDAGI